MRGFLRSIFAPYLTVIEARNGIEALEIAKSREINLILRYALRIGVSIMGTDCWE